MPKSKRSAVRAGGSAVYVENSGNEVWLYDEANHATIRTPRGKKDKGAGGMPPDFDAKTKEGLIVGYSLMQDDPVSAMVFVGEPFTEKELSSCRWLEPQTARLLLPSGALCIEGNDASRLGPEEPGEKGAVVRVPKGDYKLTLYRVDHEALDREGMEWDGPQELILLTAGGKASDAATELLPFEQRRDLAWVGQYTIKGKSAAALVWFEDYWDTFTLNLDSAAVKKLGLKSGSYLRTTVPTTGHTLISTYGASWDEAKRVPRPAGVPHDEIGYASLLKFQDWNGAEAMFCRREKAKLIAEDKHKKTWLPCTVEVLDAKPAEVVGTARGFIKTDFADKEYFSASAEFLSLILSDVLPGVGDLDELSLPDALKRLDKAFDKLILLPAGDFQWEESFDDTPTEMTARLYYGRDLCFGAVIGQEMNIHVGLFTERADGQWHVTGVLDDFANMVSLAASKRPKGPTSKVECVDESLRKILDIHEKAVKKLEVNAAPTTRDDVEAAFRRFLTTAFG
jgi:hypothetical protein